MSFPSDGGNGKAKLKAGDLSPTGHAVERDQLSAAVQLFVKERACQTQRKLEECIASELSAFRELLLADVEYATCDSRHPCGKCRALLDDEVVDERPCERMPSLQNASDSASLGDGGRSFEVLAKGSARSASSAGPHVLHSSLKDSRSRSIMHAPSANSSERMTKAMTGPGRVISNTGDHVAFAEATSPSSLIPASSDWTPLATGSGPPDVFRSLAGVDTDKPFTSAKAALQRSLTTNLNFLLLPEWQEAGEQRPHSVFSRTESMQDCEKVDSELELIDEPEYREEGKCAMNPNSKPRLAWDLMGIVVLVYDLMATPLEIAFNLPNNTFLQVVSLTVLCYWTMDIPLSFAVGYHRADGRLILNCRRIAKKYITTWFTLDIFLVSIDWLFTLPRTGLDLGGLSFGLTFRVLRVVRVLRLLRLGKLRPLLFRFQDHISSEYVTTLISISKYITFIIAVNHFIACGWHWLAKSFEDDRSTWTWLKEAGISEKGIALRYATALHWSLTQFTPASMEVVPENIYERWYSVLVLLFALCVFGSFVSSVTAAMTNLRRMTTWLDSQLWLLRKYFRERGVSRRLSGRIQRYVTLRVEAQRARVQESSCELLKLITPALNNELRSELCAPHIHQHYLFDIIMQRSEGLIRSLCLSAFTSVRFSRSDVIFNMGHKAQSMLFVTFGIISYRPAWENAQSIRLSEGECCCEPSLWMLWAHVGRAHAAVESEIMDLNARKFRDIVMEHPSQVRIVREYGAAFVRTLQDMHDGGTDISDVGIREKGAVTIPNLGRNSMNRPTVIPPKSSPSAFDLSDTSVVPTHPEAMQEELQSPSEPSPRVKRRRNAFHFLPRRWRVRWCMRRATMRQTSR
mmetsp:Transcript_38880/g.91537  ORF Transcript_38880/g.91537 Transcript_38880/m.91537 type:complete len:858 (+) Transcript_38880:154-2727(+)